MEGAGKVFDEAYNDDKWIYCPAAHQTVVVYTPLFFSFFLGNKPHWSPVSLWLRLGTEVFSVLEKNLLRVKMNTTEPVPVDRGGGERGGRRRGGDVGDRTEQDKGQFNRLNWKQE